MRRKYGRRIVCICISVIFLIAVFGRIDHLKSHPYTVQRQAETGTMQGMESYLSAENVMGVDDFHITSNEGRSVSGVFAGVRGAALWLFALILLWFLGNVLPKRRISFRKKRIYVFRVVTFIHRTDGKKKSCFDMVNQIKTGGCKWRLEQSIKYCL